MLQSLVSALMGAPSRWRVERALQRAVELRDSGASADAAMLLEQAMDRDAGNVEMLLLLSDIRREQRRTADAVRLARQAALRAPENGDAFALLGAALSLAGDDTAAADAYSSATNLDPGNRAWRLDLAAALLRLNRAADALPHLAHLLEQQPESAATHALMGLALHRLSRVDDALRYFERAALLDPADASARINHALVLRDAGRLDEAEAALRDVLARNPQDAGASNNLAVVLADRGRHDEARKLLEPIVEAQAELLEPRCTLARILFDLGDVARARACLDDAVARHPRSADARLSRAICALALGDFAGGWDDYASRVATLETPRRGFPYPEWDGNAPQDRSILVYAEQGIGDEIMFANCYPDLLAEARRVVIECDPRLLVLWRRSFPQAAVHADRSRGAHAWLSDAGPIDAQIPAGSLPRRYRRSPEAFPVHRGYLTPDPDKVARYRARLDEFGTARRVGLAWRGGLAKTRRALRSVDPAQLRPLLDRNDTHFICLQHGLEEADLALLEDVAGSRVHHWRDSLADVDETAALICALDFTVTVCNYLVHLGGALGRDVRVLVPSTPEWRYLRTGERMPWYPSVRLFRQEDPSNWEPVLHRLAASW